MLTLGFFALRCLSLAQSLPEPILRSAQMPMYPPVALAARIEGEVKVSFVLDDKGEVASVNVKSGHQILREATVAVVKSWKFDLPKNLFRTEWKYDTTFRYHLSGKELHSKETAQLTIVMDSFHNVDVASDAYKLVTVMQISH